MRSFFRFLVPVAVVILLGGCAQTHTYVPSEKTFSLPDILLPKTESPQKVAVAMEQLGTNTVTIFKRGPRTWVGDLELWSDVAARLMQIQLEKKNYMQDDAAPKSLKVRVVDASGSDAFWTIRAKVSLTVETGDGMKGVFLGENGSPAALGRAVDGALMFAVNQALNSKLVIDYLAGPGTWAKAAESIEKKE